ncbi:DUF6428 family protein [Algicella marina]|uniref:Uncharacterized protein n=1 Tax=Algicella marina TaxID=2683284 RepID=A0A6P1SWM1_9RHOB|nr:DUF6428 family protein [Algicella marina]QHQ33881.1 hypothetical protein GO499_01130 [Algicella marina]
MPTCPNSLTGLAAALAPHSDKPLEISLDAQPVPAGYHVTELKAASIRSIDCSGRQSAWDETQIQLLDGSGEGDFMATAKFLAIVDRSRTTLPALDHGTLVFETSPGRGPLQRATLDAITFEGGTVRLALTAETTACKPARQGGCCTPATACCSAA